MKALWIVLVVSVLVLAFLYMYNPTKPSAQVPRMAALAPPAPLAASKMSTNASKVQELQNEKEGDEFLAGTGILMTYAPWCGHCKHMMPAFDEASLQSTVKFGRLEGAKAQSFMQKHGIRGFPTLLTSKNGEIQRYSSGRDVASLLQAASALSL